MNYVCLDMEGVLTPEIWKQVAAATGIEELGTTTRDIPDYDKLMQMRLDILSREGLGIDVLQSAVAQLEPLPGALDFIRWVRQRCLFAVVSDTFYEIAKPLISALEMPTLFCNRLSIDAQGKISGYAIRQPQQKRRVVDALQQLQYKVLAAGDSHNDLGMLEQAERGYWYQAPQKIIDMRPEFPPVANFDELKAAVESFIKQGNG